MDKLPPIEKIPEAYSAIVDERVIMRKSEAEIRSSNGSKNYIVRWEGDTYSSTDSATYWQGYAGYPVLSVLMLQGKLPLNREVAGCFGGINWADLNKRYNRDYGAAFAEILNNIRQRGTDTTVIIDEIEKVYGLLPTLPIVTKRGRENRRGE